MAVNKFNIMPWASTGGYKGQYVPGVGIAQIDEAAKPTGQLVSQDTGQLYAPPKTVATPSASQYTPYQNLSNVGGNYYAQMKDPKNQANWGGYTQLTPQSIDWYNLDPTIKNQFAGLKPTTIQGFDPSKQANIDTWIAGSGDSPYKGMNWTNDVPYENYLKNMWDTTAAGRLSGNNTTPPPADFGGGYDFSGAPVGGGPAPYPNAGNTGGADAKTIARYESVHGAGSWLRDHPDTTGNNGYTANTSDRGTSSLDNTGGRIPAATGDPNLPNPAVLTNYTPDRTGRGVLGNNSTAGTVDLVNRDLNHAQTLQGALQNPTVNAYLNKVWGLNSTGGANNTADGNNTTGGTGGDNGALGGNNGYNFQPSAGWDWKTQVAQKNLQRYLESIGRGDSSFGINAMGSMYNNMASAEEQEYYSRLMDQNNIGMWATAMANNQEGNMANILASLYSGYGNNQAASDTNYSNSMANMLNNYFQAQGGVDAGTASNMTTLMMQMMGIGVQNNQFQATGQANAAMANGVNNAMLDSGVGNTFMNMMKLYLASQSKNKVI